MDKEKICRVCGRVITGQRRVFCSQECSDTYYNYSGSDYHKKYRQDNNARIKKNREKWNEENPDYYKRYYETHRDHIREYASDYYKKHYDKMRETTRIWQQENKEKNRLYQRERRKKMKLKQKGGTETDGDGNILID